VIVAPDSYFSDEDASLPIVIQFVADETKRAFPYGAEGYAGMCGYAVWHCEPPHIWGDLHYQCEILPEDTDTIDGETIRLVLVDTDLAASTEEIIGFTLHEMTHVLGSIDGARCPSWDDDINRSLLPPDPSDAYWWFGVQGVFTLRPEGVAWDAINGNCADCDDPTLCEELADVLAKVYLDRG
jgi:hypothetical protein